MQINRLQLHIYYMQTFRFTEKELKLNKELKLSADDVLMLRYQWNEIIWRFAYLSLSAAGAVNLLKCSILSLCTDCVSCSCWATRCWSSVVKQHMLCWRRAIVFPQKWLVMRIMKLLLNIMLPLYLEPPWTDSLRSNEAISCVSVFSVLCLCSLLTFMLLIIIMNGLP